MSDDLISRRAAIEEIRTYITKPNISDDESEIEGYNDGLELAISVLSVLPSVQPERKTGTWIKHISDIYPADSTIECNICHAEQTLGCDENYCPNCGARMLGDIYTSENIVDDGKI